MTFLNVSDLKDFLYTKLLCAFKMGYSFSNSSNSPNYYFPFISSKIFNMITKTFASEIKDISLYNIFDKT